MILTRSGPHESHNGMHPDREPCEPLIENLTLLALSARRVMRARRLIDVLAYYPAV